MNRVRAIGAAVAAAGIGAAAYGGHSASYDQGVDFAKAELGDGFGQSVTEVEQRGARAWCSGWDTGRRRADQRYRQRIRPGSLVA
jgi:hypothetical protein